MNPVSDIVSPFLFLVLGTQLVGLIFVTYRGLSYALGSYIVTLWEVKLFSFSYLILLNTYILLTWYLCSFSQTLLTKIEELKNAFSNIKFCKEMNETEFVDEKNSIYFQLDGFQGFNAENYFTVNNSLMTGMTANFVTYLIVLIQFKITENSS